MKSGFINSEVVVVMGCGSWRSLVAVRARLLGCCVLKPGSGARLDLILSYHTRSVPTNLGEVTDGCARRHLSTKQYKLHRADYCLFACMDHVATLRKYSQSSLTAGTLHIRPCSVSSLPMAFGLVPGIGEILWTRRARYGIREE